MTTLPASYLQSRERFRTRLSTLQERRPGATLTALPLPSDRDLTIDVLSAPPLNEKKRLLVMTTGQHGIEGFLGSALLELFCEEFLPRLDPSTTGLLLVHAINPWGMAHWERNNAANVDLNRNFVDGDFATLAGTNPDYPALSAFFNPRRPLGGPFAAQASFARSTLKNFIAFGPKRIREAALMGQYRFPRGIYYGGEAFQPETAALMDLYRREFAGYREIIHLDLHTGYGPRDQMTLVTSPRETKPAEEISARFDAPRVAAANPEEFYSIQGDMIDWEYDLVSHSFPEMRFFAATCEFGTYGDSFPQAARSLRTTILKNQMQQYGGSPAAAAWVEREYRELYLPSDPAWLRQALADARRTFAAAVARL